MNNEFIAFFAFTIKTQSSCLSSSAKYRKGAASRTEPPAARTKKNLAAASFTRAGEVLDVIPPYPNTYYLHVWLIETLANAAKRLEKLKNLSYGWNNFRHNPTYMGREHHLMGQVLFAKNDTLGSIAELKKKHVVVRPDEPLPDGRFLGLDSISQCAGDEQALERRADNP